MKKWIFRFCLLAGVSGQIHAKVVLPDILSDNMVLQQKSDVNIWGEASPDAIVEVTPSWSGVTFKAHADEEGKWSVKLPTPEASFTPWNIDISDGEEISLRNILIGEVWFCSGQSNMEMPLNGFWNCPVENANESIATAGEWEGIRMAVIPKTASLVPQTHVVGKWKESTPENAQWFSAVAFSFAQMLNRVLRVPVGIISCAWGGSRVEGWLPEDIVRCYDDVSLEKEQVVPEDGKEWDYRTPVVMYNGMLYPLHRYTIKGFLWYQGESNVGKHESYGKRLETMVAHWRNLWGQGELPFYLAELAPYDYGENISGALFRETQYQVASRLVNSGMICTNDLVYPYELKQIHPCRKREVGNRFAYMALNKTYGYQSIACEAPSYKSMEIKNDTIELFFNHADEGFSPWNNIEGFEIAGDDKVFHPAQATLNIDKRTIEVVTPEVTCPVAVRYGFRNFQPGNLKNHRGLPLIPFRTDCW